MMSAGEETTLDPRIQIELEKLNQATENINKFEIELDEAKLEFRRLLTESVDRIKQLSGKLENSIKLAKPYYDARLHSTEVAKNTHKAAASYEKAKSFNAAAKEMVFLAEQGFGKKPILDAACQEMLSHATSRVNETQQQCADMEHSLKLCEIKQEFALGKVNALQAQLKAAIKSSRPYYESRANSISSFNEHKDKITTLESKVSEAKMSYNDTLRCLELISEEIHKMRQDKVDLLNNQKNYINHHSTSHNRIDYRDEYLDFPASWSPSRTQATTAPHMADYENTPDEEHTDSETFHRSQGYSQIDSNKDDNTEKWTEIILSDPYSGTSAACTPNSNNDNDVMKDGMTGKSDIEDDDDEDEENNVGSSLVDPENNGKKYPESLANWITKSNLKNKERRQSLDILYDAGDRVKDVFAQGIQKVGRTLERRNSESEASLEFFFLNRSENLTDEQVENLHLNKSISSIAEDYLNIIK